MFRRLRPYALASLGAVLTITLLVALRSRLDLTTVALAMVLAVMFCALLWRSGPALWASVLSVLCFNYFFIVPYHSFTIADPANWIAFTAFAVTAIIVGQLSARAETRATQAEKRRLEIESLYQQLQKATGEAAEAEVLRRSEKLKSALLDAVTHDLRTPLTSIKAAVTTILSDHQSDSEGRLELLQVINEESDRLNRFIQEMMDLARIESGPDALRHSAGSVQEIVEIALDRAAPLLKDRKVTADVQEDLPELLVDPSAISQALYALLDNAAKFSPPGSAIHITASVDASHSIRISVEDQGEGIAEQDRARVFDKFFRAQIRKSARSGFGLGLPIAKGIVEAHGGRIWIEPSPPPGARVAFSLPIRALAATERSA